MLIAGYAMVRKPEFEEKNEGVSLKAINGIYYCGLYRSIWFDIKELFRKGKLPIELKQKYNRLSQSGNDYSFLELTKTLQEAQDFIDVNNEIKFKNEIIAISSPYLTETKKGFKPPEEIEWLGYDFVQLGGWSLIRHAIFENGLLDLIKEKPINNFGLFDDFNNVDLFLNRYNEYAKLDLVDPILEDKRIAFEKIRIGRPKF